jgi:hypothetical protein
VELKSSRLLKLIPAEPAMEENKNRDDELGSVAPFSLLNTIGINGRWSMIIVFTAFLVLYVQI